MEHDVIKYTIPLQAIEEGLLEITYEMQKAFIEQNSFEDILDADILLSIEFEKLNNLHSITYSGQGNITALCDRCVEECKVPIFFEHTLVVKNASSVERFGDEEDVVFFNETDAEIDITEHVTDSLLLSLPIKRVHEQADMCADFIDTYTQSNNKEDIIDPRWEALRKHSNNLK